MSLTGHLKSAGSPVREFFLSNFANAKPARQALALLPASAELLVTSASLPGQSPLRTWRANDPVVLPAVMEGYPWATTGTAFDYRLRFFLGTSSLTDLVAYGGASDLASHWNLRNSVPAAFDELIKKFDALKKREPKWDVAPSSRAQRELAEISYVLAIYEQCFRAPWGPDWPAVRNGKDATLEALIETAQESLIEDVRRLAEEFVKSQGRLLKTRIAVLNPTFGEASVLLGGADADLIIDGRLIDIKTKKVAEIERDELWQLLGYAFADTEDQYQISEVGFYFSRYGIQVAWNLDVLMQLMSDSQKSLNHTRSTFISILRGIDE